MSQTYGLTESCSQATTTPLAAIGEDPRAAGTPLFCTKVEVAPDGEILLSGPTVAPGGRDANDGRLHTGDLGSLDEHGRLRVSGRASDTIVSGGENVAPTEVEAVLEAHPGVLEAAVIGRPDPQWGEAVSAIVVARANATLDRRGPARALRRAPRILQGPQAVHPHSRPAAAHALGQAPAAGCVSMTAESPHGVDHWEAAAPGWTRRQEEIRTLGAPVSHWMVQAIHPQPGQRVLELAAGLGETGFLAAELVAPVGGLIVSDQSEGDAGGRPRSRARAEPDERRVPGDRMPNGSTCPWQASTRCCAAGATC